MSLRIQTIRMHDSPPRGRPLLILHRTKRVWAGCAVALIACILVSPRLAMAQEDNAFARYCFAVAAAWADADASRIPVFAGESPSHRGAHSYWRHSFRGVSVPVPMHVEGWRFFLGDAHNGANLAGMRNNRLDIRFTFTSSPVASLLQTASAIPVKLQLPPPDHEPMDMVRLALEIDPEAVVCDPHNVHDTVNNLAAVFIKTMLLTGHDKAYLHADGILAHSTITGGEMWTYLFQDQFGELHEIEISYSGIDAFPRIGLEINQKALRDSVFSPAWMSLFFEAAGNPSREVLLQLRESALAHALPDSTLGFIDEKLAGFGNAAPDNRQAQ